MNQKGGVGKTTCAVNLGAALARRGKRILLVDMDAQANLSLHLNVDIYELQHSTYSLLMGRSTAHEATLFDVRPNLSVIPSNIDLSGAEIELVNTIGRERALATALNTLWPETELDFVFYDCPPSLGLVSLNALTAAEEIFLPLQTEFFALQGVTGLLEFVERICAGLGNQLAITGVIPTLYDGRTILSRDVLADIRKFFGDKVFATIIHTNVKLAEASSHGETIFEYAPDSRGADDFGDLADEMLAPRDSASGSRRRRRRRKAKKKQR